MVNEWQKSLQGLWLLHANLTFTWRLVWMDWKQMEVLPVESLQSFSACVSNKNKGNVLHIAESFPYSSLNLGLLPLPYHHPPKTGPLSLGCLPLLKKAPVLGAGKQSSNEHTLVEKEMERIKLLVTIKRC